MKLRFYSGGIVDVYEIKTGDDKDQKLEVIHTQSEKRYSVILDGICVASYTLDKLRPGAILHYNIFNDAEKCQSIEDV